MVKRTEPLQGQLVNRDVLFSIEDFCDVCNVQPEVVVLLVDHGIIEIETSSAPSGDGWYFHGESVLRGQSALRLMRDLGVNWAGAALALDLLDQLKRYR